ncbi:hypothetical protein HAX54_021390 [Datura stramonium]|uniref:Uncharacterized protein n=1 Tax=Datura stramonium TaxID=4076 RepID=A0ABS8UV12_DATST|nr:hypothetical protein [Datura stramonium]
MADGGVKNRCWKLNSCSMAAEMRWEISMWMVIEVHPLLSVGPGSQAFCMIIIVFTPLMSMIKNTTSP